MIMAIKSQHIRKKSCPQMAGYVANLYGNIILRSILHMLKVQGIDTFNTFKHSAIIQSCCKKNPYGPVLDKSK